MLKHALNIGWIDAIAMTVVGVAWAASGFPRFMEVATVGGLGFLCFGAYVWMIWDKKE